MDPRSTCHAGRRWHTHRCPPGSDDSRPWLFRAAGLLREHRDARARLGSASIDGRYLARVGPHAERALAPARHELEARNGDRVIAVGVLTIPRKATAVTVVVHADR
ncbi:MAG: hypothetical protein R6X02_23155 [Enhygromyxa sp.]